MKKTLRRRVLKPAVSSIRGVFGVWSEGTDRCPSCGQGCQIGPDFPPNLAICSLWFSVQCSSTCLQVQDDRWLETQYKDYKTSNETHTAYRLHGKILVQILDINLKKRIYKYIYSNRFKYNTWYTFCFVSQNTGSWRPSVRTVMRKLSK